MNTLSVALKKNLTLHTLCIRDASLSDDSALSLSLGLQSNAHLSTLSLADNVNLTCYGVEHLTDCLTVNSNLQVLDLSGCEGITELPSAFVEYMRMDTCSLVEVRLDGCNLGAKA